MYGLKQLPWLKKFSDNLTKIGYRQSQADYTFFVKHSLKGTTTIIVYVDDIVILGNDPKEVYKLKSHLNNEFEVKDLGTLRYFLGLEVVHSKKGIFISQRKYVLDLLIETRLLGARPVDSPLEVNHEIRMERH